MGGDPANALALEILTVAYLFIIEYGVPCVGNATDIFNNSQLELLVEPTGFASLIVFNRSV